jgi:hypothetical protein
MSTFDSRYPGAQHPALRATAVTPSNSTELTGVRALYVGGAGNVAVILKEDTVAVTFVAVPAGSILPLAVTKVMSTNTDATDIVALY